MKSILFKGLNTQEEKELRGDFISSNLLRKRICVILNEKINASNKTLRQLANYEDASWAYKQADGCGYQRALDEVINILTDSYNVD